MLHTRSKFPILIALFLSIAISACSKKDGGSTVGDGGGTGTDSALTGSGLDSGLKEGGTGSSNDLCSVEGDAYERFAVLTHSPREQVYQLAQASGFHAIYQAKPATYTKEDLTVIQNYFVQADKLVYGSLSAQIEKAVIRFGGVVGRYGDDPTDERWEALDRTYYSLVQLLRVRQTLYAAYTTVFGLQASIAWIPAYDGAIANVAPLKEFLTAINTPAFVAQYKLTNFRRERIKDAIATLTQLVAVRIADKDYVLHTNYSVEKKTAVVSLVDVADVEAAFNFKPASEEVLTALNSQSATLTAQLKDLEAKIELAVTNQSAELAAYKDQYAQVEAELTLLAALGYSELRAVLETTRLTPNYNATATYTPNQGQGGDGSSWAVGATATVKYEPTTNNSYVSAEFGSTSQGVTTSTTNASDAGEITYNKDFNLVWTATSRGNAAPEATP